MALQASPPPFVQLNRFIDARDSVNKWCAARVVQVDEASLSLRFDGWGRKWDERVSFKSSRIAPFRKHSRLYTGQTMNAIREWSFKQEELAGYQTRVEDLIKGHFAFDSAYETTQFLRGDLFTLVDCLLTAKVQSVEVVAIMVFLAKVIDLILAWLQIPDLFKYYALGISSPDLFLTDPKVALAMAYPEVLFTLERLIAGEDRTARFFRDYSIVPKDYEPCPDTTWNNHESKTLQFFANYFAKQSGFRVFLDLMKRETDKVPLEVLAQLPFHNYARLLTHAVLSGFLTDWHPAVLSRLRDLSERDLKEFEKDVCMKLLQETQLLVLQADRNANTDFVENTEMHLALALLKCQFLEKRIRGLNEFRDMIVRTGPQPRTYVGQPVQKRIPKRTLLAFMQAQDLLTTIITDRPHGEIVKRSGEIFSFYAENEALTGEHLDQLWSSRNDKHESYIRAVYDVLIAVASTLNAGLKDTLFQRFSEVPTEQYDEKYLRLLKDFTLYAADSAKTRSDVSNDYALPKFFSLMLDDPKTSTALADLSSELLLELLKSPVCRGKQEEYLDLAMTNVNNGESIPQSLKIVLGILKPSTITRSLSDQVKRLDKKFGLVNIAIKSLTNYMETARSSPSPAPEAIIAGRYSHQINLDCRFSFLEFCLLILDKSRLSMEQIDLLWTNFVVQPASRFDSDVFLKWLASTLDSPGSLTKEPPEVLFERYLCGPSFPVKGLSQEAFRCFTRFFLTCNALKRRLEVRGLSVLQRLHSDILGISSLIAITLNAEDEYVSEKAVKLLVDLHMRLSRVVMVEKDRLWTALLLLFSDKIRENMENDSVICVVLRLFNAFLDEAEGRSSLKPSKSQSSPIVVFYRLPSDPEYRKVQLPSTSTLGDARRKIAEAYKQHPYSINLTIASKLYTRFEDDTELTAFKPSIAAVVDITKTGEMIDPKTLMANNQQLLDTLFELISRPERDFAELAWSLLMRLPTNEKIKQEIAGLGEALQTHLSSESLHKLLYCLIILDELSDNPDFSDNFARKNGVNHILRIFYSNRLNDRHSPALTLKYSFVIFSLLRKFLPSIREYDPVEIIKRTLSLLWETSQSLSESEEQPKAIDTVKYATALLTKVVEALRDKAVAAQSIVAYEHLQEFLVSALLTATSPLFSDGVKELLAVLALKLGLENEMLEQLLQLVQVAVTRNTGGTAYFQLTSKLMRSAQDKLTPALISVQETLIQELQTHKCEKSTTDKDEVLAGVLTLLRAIAKRTKQVPSADFVQLVLHTCLFEVPFSGRLTAASPPKCKNAATRKEALKLLNAISAGSSDPLINIITYLDRLHQDPHWRSSRRQDWNNHHTTMERSETGFVGIKNLGCTCYMNSILQQLFMLPTFREGVLSVAVNPEHPEDDLLNQFQTVFASLQESDKQYVNPKALTKAFKPDGQALNPMEQMDVDEFFNNFMDKIESQLQPDSQAKSLIQDHFGGFQSTELIGKNSCSHRSERAEPFLTLPLEVKNKKSIYESLESFVQGEILEGDNAYQCDHCDAKVTAERRVSIRHLPNIMIFALRRFDFDLDTMNRLKLNDYCEFPMEIDLEPYTVEGLSRRDAVKEQREAPSRKFPDDYYQYRLRGIVVHMGTAESGHYYSFIEDSKRWYEFNDTVVREFDPKEIPAEAFGGEEKWNITTGYGAQVVSLREKYRNAYLLFYERTGKYARRASDEDTLTAIQPMLRRQHSITVVNLYSQVQDDNQKLWRRRNAFSHEYFDFLLKLAATHLQEVRCWKFLLSFFLTIFVRSKEKYKVEEMVRAVKTGVTKQMEVAQWFLEAVSVEQVIKELILECPEASMRKLIVIIAKTALKKTAAPQHEAFALRLLKCLPQAKKNASRYFNHYFELLDAAAEACPQLYDQFALSARLLTHVFDDHKALPDLPDPSPPQHLDIYLGYEDGKAVDSLYDKYVYTFYDNNTSYSYLLRTLARFPEKLKQDDLRRYFTSRTSLLSLVREATTKVGSKALARIMSFLCADSLTVSADYVKVLMSLLHEYDYDKHKPILRQVLALLRMSDGVAEERMEMVLGQLMGVLRENAQFIKATESCVDFLFKCFSRLEAVQRFINSRRIEMRPLEDWVKRGSASGYSSQTPMSTYKQRIQTTASSYASPKPSAERLDQAKRLLRSDPADLRTAWDSDDEAPVKSLKSGERLDVVNVTYARWDKGTVVHNFGDLMLVRTELDKALMWVETDGDQVAPDGAKTGQRTVIGSSTNQ